MVDVCEAADADDQQNLGLRSDVQGAARRRVPLGLGLGPLDFKVRPGVVHGAAEDLVPLGGVLGPYPGREHQGSHLALLGGAAAAELCLGHAQQPSTAGNRANSTVPGRTRDPATRGPACRGGGGREGKGREGKGR